MVEIEYNYRNGKDKLSITYENGWYSIRRYLFAPRTNRWVFWESFSIKTKTGIFLYILDKDPNVDLDQFINFEGM